MDRSGSGCDVGGASLLRGLEPRAAAPTRLVATVYPRRADDHRRMVTTCTACWRLPPACCALLLPAIYRLIHKPSASHPQVQPYQAATPRWRGARPLADGLLPNIQPRLSDSLPCDARDMYVYMAATIPSSGLTEESATCLLFYISVLF